MTYLLIRIEEKPQSPRDSIQIENLHREDATKRESEVADFLESLVTEKLKETGCRTLSALAWNKDTKL